MPKRLRIELRDDVREWFRQTGSVGRLSRPHLDGEEICLAETLTAD